MKYLFERFTAAQAANKRDWADAHPEFAFTAAQAANKIVEL